MTIGVRVRYNCRLMRAQLKTRYPNLAAACCLSVLLGCSGDVATDNDAGGETPSTTAATDVADLCDLLTAEEIETALGSGAGATTPGDGSCEWAGADGSEPVVRLRFTDSKLMSYADFVADFNAEFGGEEPDREEYMPVEGIGDWAMYVAEGHVLEVHVGENMFRVQTSAQSHEAAIEVAKIALPRID